MVIEKTALVRFFFVPYRQAILKSLRGCTNLKLELKISWMAKFFKYLLLCLSGVFLVGTSIASDTLGTAGRRPIFQKQLGLVMEKGPMLPKNTEWGQQVGKTIDFTAIDFRLGFKNIRPNLYNTIYKYPVYGFGYFRTTFRNDYIGKPNAFYMFGELPIGRTIADDRLSFSVYLAFGFAFNFKPWDPDDNPLNQFIGSYNNGYVHVASTMSYRLNEWVSLDGSVGLKHFSNGSIQKPNSGLNFVPFSIGIRTNLNRWDPSQNTIPEIPEFIPNHQFNTWLTMGGKSYQPGGEQYVKYALGFNWLRQKGYKFRYGLGTDIFYAPMGSMDPNFVKDTFSEKASLAFVLSGELILKPNLFIPLGLGAYVHRNEANDEPNWYYERIGVKYRFCRNFYSAITLKAHAFKADIFEFQLGYTFLRDKNKY